MILVSGLEDEMEMNKRIKNLRMAHDLSQEELAKMVGVTKQAISQYERGVRKPEYDVLEALADFFNVDYDYLLGKTDKTTVLPESYPLKLSTKEIQFIEAYRASDMNTQKIVRMLLHIDGGES
jgi:transcriptional regulator with XRE-family HTH domain